MPKVPEINHKPVKSLFNAFNPDEPASMKQKNYILILCERRKIPIPYMKHLKKGEAAQMISEMTNAPSTSPEV